MVISCRPAEGVVPSACPAGGRIDASANREAIQGAELAAFRVWTLVNRPELVDPFSSDLPAGAPPLVCDGPGCE